MSARTRRRLMSASFGPEWAPVLTGMYWALFHREPPRERSRALAHLRRARRDRATVEARWEAKA